MRTSTRCSRVARKGRTRFGKSSKLSLFIVLSVFSFFSSFAQSVSVDFSQGSNKNNTLGQIVWIGSILQKTNSRIAEGMSTLQRLQIYDIPASSSSHTVQFKILAQKSTFHAYDFITSWGQAMRFTDMVLPTGIIYPAYNAGNYYSAALNKCGDLQTGGQSPTETEICDALHTGADATPSKVRDVLFPMMPAAGAIPAGLETNFDPSGGSDTRTTQQVINAYESVFGQRSIRLFSNQPITSASIAFNGYVAEYGEYTLTYTSANSTQIMIEFAAHVAAGDDPLSSGIGYGTARGAHNISGGPYHVKYGGFDGDGGDMDNQLQGSEIFLIPNCTLPSVPTKCVGFSSFGITATVSNVDASTTYTWSIAPVVAGGPTISGTTASATINPGVAGSYTIKLQVANGEFTHDCATPFVISALPTANLTGGAFCKDVTSASVGVTGQSGGTFSAPAGLGINATTGAFNPSTATAGTYTVTYSFSNSNSCSNTATTSVTINALPTATITGGAFCKDATTGSVTLVAGSQTGGTYSAGAGLGINTTTGAFNPSTATAGTYTVTYSFTGSNGCSATATTGVTINSLPTATITGGAFCKSATTGSVALVAGSQTGGTYSAGAGLGINTSNGSFNPSTATAGTYTVTYSFTGSNGCTASATTGVTINALPTATITGGAFCKDATTGSVTLVAGSQTGGTYSAGAGLGINTTTGAFNPSTATAGTYTVTYSFTGSNGCTASTTAGVTINALPTATITGGAFCKELTTGSVTLVAGSQTGGTYSAGAGLGINSTTGAFNPSTATAGTYTVTYSFTGSNGCSATATTGVTINTQPTATITGGAFCKNVTSASVTLVAGSQIGGTYSAGAGLGINTTTGAFNPSTATAGTYTVTYSFGNSNGCSGSATTSVTINALPTATITGGAFCKDATTGSVTLVAGSQTGGTYSAGAELGINTTTGAFNPSTATAGTYTVTYSFTGSNGCTASTTAGVTINALPTATITGGAFCKDATTGSVTLVAGSQTGGTYSAGAGLGINSSTGAFNPSTATAGTYTVTYSFTGSNGCTASTTAGVTINALPTATITGGAFCKDVTTGSVTLVAGSITGGTYSAGAGLGINTTTGAFNPSSATAGTYTVTYSFGNSNGCSGTATTSVSINALPTATITGGAFCKDATSGSVTLVAGSQTGGTYSAGAGLGINTTTGVFNPSTATAGTYTVTYSFTGSNGCTASTTAGVTINALPTATITGGAFCKNVTSASVTLVAGSQTGGTYSAGAGLGINSSTGAFNPSTATAGTYTVTYSFTGSNGCTATATTGVTINDLPTVSADSKTVCAGQLIALTGLPAGGSWSGTGVSGSNFNFATPGTYVVTYSFTGTNGCSGIATANITVNACGGVPYGTYTQGYFGNTNGNSCNNGQTFNSPLDLIKRLLGVTAPSGQTPVANPLIVGVKDAAHPEYTYIEFAGTDCAATALNNAMPGGQTPNKLLYGDVSIDCIVTGNWASYLTKQSRINNVLLSQTIALSLNTRLGGMLPNSGNLLNFPIKYNGGQDAYFYVQNLDGGCGSTTPVPCSYQKVTIPASVVNYLTQNGTVTATVSDLLALANKLLGGALVPGSGVPSYADVTAAIDAFNKGFDEWKFYDGNNYNTNYTNPTLSGVSATLNAPCAATSVSISHSGTTGAPYQYMITWTTKPGGSTLANTGWLSLSAAAINISLVGQPLGNYAGTIKVRNSNTGCETSAQSFSFSLSACLTTTSRDVTTLAEATQTFDKLNVAAYPNPFRDVVKFTIESPVSGQARLEVYNVAGQKVALVYNGYIQANKAQIVEFRANTKAQQNLMYILFIGGKQVTGKLMNLQ